MKLLPVCSLLLAALAASAQVASHASTAVVTKSAPAPSNVRITDKPVAKVNGTVLTDRDLVREMFAIFPYARQHNGFPKGEEAQIRRGAMDMIVFDELVYQEALRRKLTVSPESVTHAVREYRGQFDSEEQFQEYLRVECRGSRQVLRARVQRALLIEKLVKSELDAKSMMSLLQVKAYYDSHSVEFMHGESYSFQTISVILPNNPNPSQKSEARKRADELLKAARATKSYQEFGLLAEKSSDDDFRVNMGDHKAVEVSKLPPEVIAVFKTMKPGQVSGLIPLGPNYAIVRLNEHILAGKDRFEDVKAKIRDEQQKIRYSKLRAELSDRLRKNAKVEIY